MAINPAERLMATGMTRETAVETVRQIQGGGGGITSDSIAVPEITTAGGTTIPAGTLTETLQAIADLADPDD